MSLVLSDLPQKNVADAERPQQTDSASAPAALDPRTCWRLGEEPKQCKLVTNHVVLSAFLRLDAGAGRQHFARAAGLSSVVLVDAGLGGWLAEPVVRGAEMPVSE